MASLSKKEVKRLKYYAEIGIRAAYYNAYGDKERSAIDRDEEKVKKSLDKLAADHREDFGDCEY